MPFDPRASLLPERGEDFEGFYSGTPPWDIGRPQSAFVGLSVAARCSATWPRDSSSHTGAEKQTAVTSPAVSTMRARWCGLRRTTRPVLGVRLRGRIIRAQR